MAARVAPPTPPLICKFAAGGKGPLGATSYDAEKPGATLLWTNLEGSTTPRSWARQIGAFRDLNKRLKRVVDHVSLSLDPRLGKLTPGQWLVAAKVWLHDMGYGNRAVIIHRHVDEPQDHIHLVICRLDALGQAHSDSNIFRRGHAAAVAAAKALGLVALPRDGDGDDSTAAKPAPAPADAAVAAGRRAKRRGTPTAKPGSLAAAFDSLVTLCTSIDEIEARAHEADIEVKIHRKSGGDIQGISARAVGVIEWEKASSLGREFGWGAVQIRLAENAARRARAQASADAANASARERAAERLAARPQRIVSQARALSPGATAQAKEATMNVNDPFDFLTPPPPPPIYGGLAARAEEDDDARRRRQRDELDLEIQADLRKLSVRELLDLQNPKIPDFFLSAAALQALLNMILRWLSLGVIRKENTLSNALDAREHLTKIAGAELARRRRTPGGAKERRDALAERQALLQKRNEALDDKGSERLQIAQDLHGAAHRRQARAQRRKELEAGFDRLQVSRGLATIKKRRAERDAAVTEHRAARDGVPVAMGMLMVPARRAARQIENAARAKRLAAAVARRAAAQAALAEFMDQILEEQRREEEEKAASIEIAMASEKKEHEAISRELRELPDQVLAANAEAAAEAKSAAAAAVAARDEVSQQPAVRAQGGEAEDAEGVNEAERARLRRLAGKGG